MDLDEAPIIYGLELPSRCMCAQTAETNIIRFLAATQSLRQENQIHFIEFDDENNMIDKTVYSHPMGEVWHLSSSFNSEDLFSTCYHDFEHGKIVSGCAVLKLPAKGEKEEKHLPTQYDSSPGHLGTLEQVALLETKEFGDVLSSHWKPIENENLLMAVTKNHLLLYDINVSQAELMSSFSLPNKKGHPHTITAGRWNPHHGGKQFAVTTEQNVVGWDVRSKEQAFYLDNAHSQMVREVDFNPNKMYSMVTCGDDCQVKFWDIRYPDNPIKVLMDDHSHWVWSVRYNPFHDQLVLSGGSDSKIVLYNMSSISSEPYIQQTSSGEESSHDSDEENEQTAKLEEDGVLSIYEEHEDSVYIVEWSSADPWTFASLSYDGRFVINRVPKKVKYDILL